MKSLQCRFTETCKRKGCSHKELHEFTRECLTGCCRCEEAEGFTGGYSAGNWQQVNARLDRGESAIFEEQDVIFGLLCKALGVQV